MTPSCFDTRATDSTVADRLRILVLGGTGFIGSHVCRQLVHEGHIVTVLHRGRRPTPPGVAQVVLDRVVDNLDALRSQPFDAIVDVGFRLADGVTCAHTVEGVARILESLHPGYRRYVMISSVAVHHIDQEKYPGIISRWYLDYAHTKAAAEKHLLERIPDRALSLRAPIITGPGDWTGRFDYKDGVPYWRQDASGARGEPLGGKQVTSAVDVRVFAKYVVAKLVSNQTGADETWHYINYFGV